MESEESPPSTSQEKCCDCDCSCSIMSRSLSGTYLRSVKRKYDEFEEENRFTIPGFVLPQNARVEIGNECVALRETVTSQQQTIQDLISELDEERNASSSAANEAMSMILRLQRDKSEIQMESRQFKRFAEEKMAHDQEEALALEDLLYKREQAIQSLTCEVQAYKHRMMSYGLTDVEAESINKGITENLQGQFDFMPYEIYPPLKCNSNVSQAYADDNNDDEIPDIEKYASGDTPRPRDQLKDLEFRINQLEKSPRAIQNQTDGEFVGSKNVLEKIIVGHSPKHLRKFSTDSSKEVGPDFPRYSPRFGNSFKKTEFSHIEEKKSNLINVDKTSEDGDNLSDRVYTIDSIYPGSSNNGPMDCKDEYLASPKDALNQSDVRDIEIQKLYARLHALEADRESMRQSIISIGTDKAQLVLLKEIAQNLCKEMSPPRPMPVRKQSGAGIFYFMSIFKWIAPIFFWRKKARKCKYNFGLSANNAGLPMLLDRGPRVGQWRCLSSTHL